MDRYVSLVLSITDRCNFKCKHCLKNQGHSYLSPAVLDKFLKDTSNIIVPIVSFTGGETLLHPELEDFFRICKENNLKFQVITNGWEFQNKFDLIKKHKNNIEDVVFSVDGGAEVHDSIRREGSFEKIVVDIQLCNDENIPVRFSTSFSRLNFSQDEIMNIVALYKTVKNKAGWSMFPALLTPGLLRHNAYLNSEERTTLTKLIHKLRNKNFNIISCNYAENFQGGLKEKCVGCHDMEGRGITIDSLGNLTMCCNLCDHEFSSDKDIVGNVLENNSVDLIHKRDIMAAQFKHSYYKNKQDGLLSDFLQRSICDYCMQYYGKLNWVRSLPLLPPEYEDYLLVKPQPRIKCNCACGK